jgi:hypothetical protein
MGFLSALHTNSGRSSYRLRENCPQNRTFWRSIEPSGWENWTVLNYHRPCRFSERCNTAVVIAVKIFQKNFNCFVTASENLRAGVKKMSDFSMFLAVVTWFWTFRKSSPKYKSQIRTHVRAKFGADRSRDGWESLAEEKKRKKRVDGKL